MIINSSIFSVSVDNLVETYRLHKLSLLREFCKKTGVQVLHREYEFDDKKVPPFCDDDILNIFPVVKYVTPKATDATTIFEAAQTRLQSGMSIYFNGNARGGGVGTNYNIL